MPKKTLADLRDLRGKRVLVRVDFNVPLDAAGNVTNDGRIRAALPSIQHLLDGGACVILMSHLGRPKGDPKKDAPYKKDRVAKRLEELLGRPVTKVNDVVGPEVEAAVRSLQPGQVLVLENLRFHPGEQTGDPAFAAQLAGLADIYVNDAFGTCHRHDASIVAVPASMQQKPRVLGRLVARELEVLDQLLSTPKRPFLAILGGAKVSDKIGFINSLLGRVDRVLIGGAMSYTFMKAQGRSIGNSKAEVDKIGLARDLLRLGENKICLPVDHLVVQRLDMPGETKVVQGDIPEGWIGVDIGPQTVAQYRAEIGRARTIVWNGPMGKYEEERYSGGTRAIAESLAASGATTVVGGGETAEAVEAFGLAGKMTHVSTGGGAFLEYLEGSPFPALAQIEDRKTS
jgi:phosphoglycerate kinase